MARANLSPELERKYSHELIETMERVDNLRADLKEEVKERKGEIAALEKAAYRLRRLLGGKEVEQTEIPGAASPSVKPRKGLTAVTLHAGDRSVTATPEQLKAGLAELERRKKKADDITWTFEGLDWSGKGRDGRKYSVTSGPRGWSWQLHGSGLGAGGSGPYRTLEEAKAGAEKREVEQRARKAWKGTARG